MARDGLSSLLCAGLLLGALSPLAAAGDSHTEYARGLAVQVALNQGRKHILDGNYEAAIKVLESQIAHIDGSGEYLIALRDAYRGAINQLRRAGRPTRSEEHTSELQSLRHLVCRLLLEKKKKTT